MARASGSASSAACQLVRNGDGARLGVELDVHVDFVPAGDARTGAMLGAHPDHRLPVHRGHRGPIRVVADRHADRRFAPGAERLHHRFGHLDAGGGLAALQDRGPELHRALIGHRMRQGLRVGGPDRIRTGDLQRDRLAC